MALVARRGRDPAGPRRLAGVLAVSVALVAACSNGEHKEASSTTRPTDRSPTSETTQTIVAPSAQPVVVRGTATLDGRTFDAEFLGAVVRDQGLATPCQQDLSLVTDGRYLVTVLDDQEGSGCGRPGADIVLWTFVDDHRLFSTAAVPWPSEGTTATFDATFSSA